MQSLYMHSTHFSDLELFAFVGLDLVLRAAGIVEGDVGASPESSPELRSSLTYLVQSSTSDPGPSSTADTGQTSSELEFFSLVGS